MIPERVRRTAVATVAFAALTTTPLANAQVQAPDIEISLASQTAWVAAEGEMVLRVALAGAGVPPPSPPSIEPPAESDAPPEAPGPELVIQVHDRLTSRSAFALTLGDGPSGRVVDTTRAPLASLDRDPAGAVTVRLGISAGGAPPADPGVTPRITLRQPGVYPVGVSVVDDGEVIDSFVTHLVRLPSDEAEPLRLAFVVPIHSPPAAGGAGGDRLAPAERRRVEDLSESLSTSNRVPIVLAPTPETLDALAHTENPEDVETLERIRARAATDHLLAGPYVPPDPIELVSTGLESELGAQLAVGAEVIQEHLGVAPATGTWLSRTRLDEASLSALRESGISRVVVEESVLEPLDRALTLTQPFVLRGSLGRRTVALVADPGLTARLQQRGDPVLAAHHFLADLAVLYFDEPARPRAVVARAPDDWGPPRATVETILAAVANSPVLESVDVETASAVPLARAADGDALEREMFSVDPPAASELIRIDAVRQVLRSFASMVPPDIPPLATIERRLLAAQSVDLTGGQQATMVQAAASALQDELGQVDVPSTRSITLTAREGEVPVTIRSDAPWPVDVVVSLDADQLRFPAGQTRQMTLARGNTTARFRVEARTSGAFPLRVRVTSPDGALVLGQTRYTVRSTVVSGVGIVLTSASVAFLVAWWGLHVRRTRRGQTAGQ